MDNKADIPTLTALLARTAKAFTIRDNEQKAVAEAQDRLNSANQQVTNAQAAFALFDMQVITSEDWNRLRELIGSDAYDRAIAEGIAMAEQAIRTYPKRANEVTGSNAEEIERADDHAQAALFDSPADRPTIKELVLGRLKAAGAVGSKARPIREFIEKVYSTELHEKTVGMTLYRLSLDGLVRRKGQTWFIAPQAAETMNPGVGAPGSD
jgi:hypothetical protein